MINIMRFSRIVHGQGGKSARLPILPTAPPRKANSTAVGRDTNPQELVWQVV